MGLLAVQHRSRNSRHEKVVQAEFDDRDEFSPTSEKQKYLHVLDNHLYRSFWQRSQAPLQWGRVFREFLAILLVNTPSKVTCKRKFTDSLIGDCFQGV